MTAHTKVEVPITFRRIRRAVWRWIGNFQPISDAALPRFTALDSTFLSDHGYSSQLGQDYLVDRLLTCDSKSGVFVDVGAHDGVSWSNTYYLEKVRGWTGICIEPNPVVFPILEANRNVICLPIAIANEDGDVDFTQVAGEAEMLSGVSTSYESRHWRRVKREVKRTKGGFRQIQVRARPLQSIFDEYELSRIDFLSVDTEGSEKVVLETIDFNRTRVDVILVERNYTSRGVPRLLRQRGFHRIFSLEWDDVYINTDLELLATS